MNNETDPTMLRENLLSDPDKFTRFVNSMVRLAEGGIKCAVHKCQVQDREAEAAKQKNATERCSPNGSGIILRPSVLDANKEAR